MRQNLNLAWTLSLVIGLAMTAGCQSTGFKMPTMPNLAFWKKDGLQWTKKDPIPPPATHFDPEPLKGGFTRERQVADTNSSSSPIQKRKPNGFPSQGSSSAKLASDTKNDSAVPPSSLGSSKKPIRPPYKYDASDSLANNSDDAFQPNVVIKKQLPDFGSSSLTPGESSAFVPPRVAAKSPISKKQVDTPNDQAFIPEPSRVKSAIQSPAKSAVNDLAKVRTDFQNKIASQFPGMANHFNASEKAGMTPPETKFPTLTPNKNPKQGVPTNNAFAPKIQTPNRVALAPQSPPPSLGGRLNKILTPNIEKQPNSTPPSNQLRVASQNPNPQRSGSYPSTHFNGLSPLRGQPASNSGTTLAPMNSTSNSQRTATTKVNDVLLPPSLRSANISFTPGNVSKLAPNPASKNTNQDSILR